MVIGMCPTNVLGFVCRVSIGCATYKRAQFLVSHFFAPFSPFPLFFILFVITVSPLQWIALLPV
jgi:hypothetical protein